MEKIQGWDEAPAYTGESVSLPAGLYKCLIKQVNVVNDDKGREVAVILYDIVEDIEGNKEFKDFYKKQFDVRKQNDSNAKWGGIFRQFTKDKGLPFFKGIITSIEKSNSGYKWDWNEKGLAGKFFGGVFGREEFSTSDGNKWATKCVGIRSLDGLKESKVPEDKPLDDKYHSPAAPSDAAFTGTLGADGFMNIPDGLDDEALPFM